MKIPKTESETSNIKDIKTSEEYQQVGLTDSDKGQNFWSKFSLTTEKDDLSRVSQLKELGKSKINEFYDKVRVNKERYNLMKSQKMDKKLNDFDKLEDRIVEHVDMCAGTIDENPKTDDQTDLSHQSFENSLNLSNISKESDFASFARKLKLSNIGRSSTSTQCSVEKNLIPSNAQSTPPRNIVLKDCRSYSIQHDDEEDEDENYLLNERSRSYSHTINNNKSNNNVSNNNDNVSSSLPNFIPINPVLKTAVSKETFFLSESPRRKSALLRDSSFQSDSSHCSSVDSLLESRKPDPEAILINLGFGPVDSEDILSRIPKRFLKPSQVRGIDTEAFLRRQQLASHLHDHSVLGYRGLLGNPDIPPSTIVAKIMERFELNERNRFIMDINVNRPQSAPPTPGPNL